MLFFLRKGATGPSIRLEEHKNITMTKFQEVKDFTSFLPFATYGILISS